MELDVVLDEAEVYRFAWGQTLEALQALARGEATVVLDDNGVASGVEWEPSDSPGCPERIGWEN